MINETVTYNTAHNDIDCPCGRKNINSIFT